MLALLLFINASHDFNAINPFFRSIYQVSTYSKQKWVPSYVSMLS